MRMLGHMEAATMLAIVHPTLHWLPHTVLYSPSKPDNFACIFKGKDCILGFFLRGENSFTGSIAFPSRFHNVGIIALRITKGNWSPGFHTKHKVSRSTVGGLETLGPGGNSIL